MELRLEALSLRDEVWIAEPASAVRVTMLMGMIQRSKELIDIIRKLPALDIAHMTITTSAHLCAAVGYMPTAVFALLNIINDPNDSTTEARAQAVIYAADYPTLITELANALETKFEGLSAAERETDIVGSLCSKMRLLARCYPHQIREIVGSVSSQDASMAAVHTDETTMTPQVWPPVYGDMNDMFSVDDIQWDSLLSTFTGFS